LNGKDIEGIDYNGKKAIIKGKKDTGKLFKPNGIVQVKGGNTYEYVKGYFDLIKEDINKESAIVYVPTDKIIIKSNEVEYFVVFKYNENKISMDSRLTSQGKR